MAGMMPLPPYSGPAYEPSAIALAILSGITLLVVPPFIWHVKNHNMPAASLMFWLLILNLMNLTNALIWPNDDIANWFSGHGVCDIQAKIIVGSFAGMNTALCAIVRSLANVLDTKNLQVAPSAARMRRESVSQWLLVWVCPVYLMIIHYVVQPNRYYIWAIAGCNPSFDNSWLSVLLVFIWPPIFALLSCYYAGLLIWRLHKYRQEFSRIMTLKKTTKSRFIRLFVLSAILIVAFVPLALYVFYNNVAVEHHAYSWSGVHGSEWGTVIPIPTAGFVLYDRWFRPAAGLTAFAFFGVGADAITMYKGWLAKLGFDRCFPSISSREQNASTNSSANTSCTLVSRLRNRFFSSSKPGDIEDLSMATSSAMTRTSVETDYSKDDQKCRCGKNARYQRDSTTLPSPIRLAVEDEGAVAVQTHVSIDEKAHGQGSPKDRWGF